MRWYNVSVLMYHYVCPAKYRRVIFSEEVDKTLKETCKEMEKRYEIKFLEIGTDKDHVHCAYVYIAECVYPQRHRVVAYNEIAYCQKYFAC